MNRSVHMKDEIIRVLSENPEITTTEISRRLGASRTTVIRYLKELHKDGIVSFRVAGPAKLWYVMSSEKGERFKELSLAREKGKLLGEDLESFISSKLRLPASTE